MKKFLYICFLFWVNSVFLMAQEKKESGQSSLYTDQYITYIYMSEPDRALQLLDEAEEGNDACAHKRFAEYGLS